MSLTTIEIARRYGAVDSAHGRGPATTRVAALACVLSACGGAADGVLDLAIAVNRDATQVVVAGAIVDPGDRHGAHVVRDRIDFGTYAALTASAPIAIEATGSAGAIGHLDLQPGLCAVACAGTDCALGDLVSESIDLVVDRTGALSVGCFRCFGDAGGVHVCP